MNFDHRSSIRIFDLILNNMYFTYTCNFSSVFYIGINHRVNKNGTTCYIYIYSAYTLFFSFLPLSAYPKPRTAFLEEREDDEDIIGEYDDCACLSWKEILSLIDNYYQVNLFLTKNNTLIFENYILSKSLYYYLIRFGICPSSACGRRGRTATSRHARTATTRHKQQIDQAKSATYMC